MQTFSNLSDAQAAIKALPGYLGPLLLESGTTETHDNGDGTFTLTRVEYWTYNQELETTNTYKTRTCILVTTTNVDSGGNQTIASVGLSLHVVSETSEGFNRVTSMPAGQQPIEYQLTSSAFELPTDADIAAGTKPRGCVAQSPTNAGAASDTNPITSYHHWQIPSSPANLVLGALAAEWQNLPRYTTFNTSTGFYLNPADQTTWYRMGGFTLNGGQGITLCGTNTTPAIMPPGGIFATVDLYPQVPILMSNGTPVLTDGAATVDTAIGMALYGHIMAGTTQVFNLYVRTEIIRTRPCDTDSNGEIRPYVDLDWELWRKK